MNEPLLKKLTEAHGVPGQEDKIRAIVREELTVTGELDVDWMGNLSCTVSPKGVNSPMRVMIAAHMDEIGFIVKYIDDQGFLKLQPLGGWDPRQMAAQRVIVHTATGPIHGVLMIQSKPKHLLSPDEMGKAPAIESFFVDIGMNAETANAAVSLGDMVTMNRDFQTMGDLCTCKAMDDRVALYVMIEALRAVKSHQVEIVAVATVQEEIGLRGASASGSAVKPDVVIAIDVTLANDIPGIPDSDAITRLGKGAAIKIMDSSLLCHPKLVKHFRTVAEKNEIAHQMEILPAGGTDAGGIQRLHGGIPAFTLSVPCRYIHTVNETVHRADVDAAVALLARYLEDAHNGDYRMI
ncbi:MAG: M42 family metallopeptidase [Chthonomonas sp.]|nr:M42 family metallopeptidase [Chthonomonas sp.]